MAEAPLFQRPWGRQRLVRDCRLVHMIAPRSFFALSELLLNWPLPRCSELLLPAASFFKLSYLVTGPWGAGLWRRPPQTLDSGAQPLKGD